VRAFFAIGIYPALNQLLRACLWKGHGQKRHAAASADGPAARRGKIGEFASRHDAEEQRHRGRESLDNPPIRFGGDGLRFAAEAFIEDLKNDGERCDWNYGTAPKENIAMSGAFYFCYGHSTRIMDIICA
jgi:hypothetical protein